MHALILLKLNILSDLSEFRYHYDILTFFSPVVDAVVDGTVVDPIVVDPTVVDPTIVVGEVVVVTTK